MSRKQSYWQQLGLQLDRQEIVKIGAIAVLGLLVLSTPAIAHHPLDGRLPANFFEGIMSGFGHPILGIDHLAFVVASGLVAVGIVGGVSIPIAFVIATAVGAGIHLLTIDLPIPEIVIAGSVVLFGILLIVRNNREQAANYTPIVSGIAGLAGIFHGYAYGEGIFGAEPTPVVAYLIGLTIIQLAISLGVYGILKAIKGIPGRVFNRFVGLFISGIGIAFLSSAMTG